MAFKDLEHNGDEDYLDKEKSRGDVLKDLKAKKAKQLSKDEIIDHLQDRWLSPENPFLWSGDF